MRADHLALKATAFVPAIAILLTLFSPAVGRADREQDLTFRLMNIERRLDQLQSRVDTVERTLQNQALGNNSSSLSTQALFELQRQQLSLAEQVVTMQRQMLEMQKAIDRLSEKSSEKSEKPKEEAKPKAPPKKP